MASKPPDTPTTFSADHRRPWMFAFLVAFAAGGNISEAARIAKVARRTVYLARETDPEFASAWEDALAEAADRIHAEMFRRGVEGWEEPIIGRVEEGRDGQVGTVRKFDGGLLARLAVAHCPEFREKAPAAPPVRVHVTISPERLQQLQGRTGKVQTELGGTPQG